MAAVVAGKVRRQRRAEENAFKVLFKWNPNHLIAKQAQDAFPKVIICHDLQSHGSFTDI